MKKEIIMRFFFPSLLRITFLFYMCMSLMSWLSPTDFCRPTWIHLTTFVRVCVCVGPNCVRGRISTVSRGEQRRRPTWLTAGSFFPPKNFPANRRRRRRFQVDSLTLTDFSSTEKFVMTGSPAELPRTHTIHRTIYCVPVAIKVFSHLHLFEQAPSSIKRAFSFRLRRGEPKIVRKKYRFSTANTLQCQVRALSIPHRITFFRTFLL